MRINNLHSLLSGRWFIDEQYGHSLLPSLFSVLNGIMPAPPAIKNTETFIAVKNDIIAADSFDNNAQKDGYALIISLKEPIYKYNQSCGPDGTKTKQKIMERYLSDTACKGVVLDIDSGGGQVSGTPEFHDFIKNYAKPVVAYTDGLMCSAAYYIGSASDHIIANTRADAIGSIGTMVHFVDITGAYEKLGAKVITEYATKSTEKNKDFEDLLKGDSKGYIKNVLDHITDNFHADVKVQRKNLKEEVLKGGTYNAQEALKNGLIDEIGTLQTAIDKVFALAKNNASNSNINNSNHKSMSKLNVPLIEAAIGAPFSEGETENGILLTDAQAQAVETLLTSNAKAIEDADASAVTAAAVISNLQTAASDVNEAVHSALIAAGIDGAAEMGTINGIDALSALISKYGEKDGAGQTQAPRGIDGSDTDTQIVSGVDLSRALNC